MKKTSIIDVMTKNVVCVSPEQHLLDVKHIYEKDKFHHHIPVTQNEKLVGMVSLIDFMYNIAGAGMNDNNEIYQKLKVKDIMTQKPFYLKTDATIEEVANVLVEGNYHAIPVIENDKIVGIVSTADLIKHFLVEAL